MYYYQIKILIEVLTYIHSGKNTILSKIISQWEFYFHYSLGLIRFKKQINPRISIIILKIQGILHILILKAKYKSRIEKMNNSYSPYFRINKLFLRNMKLMIL